jgi:hypothetical protein
VTSTSGTPCARQSSPKCRRRCYATVIVGRQSVNEFTRTEHDRKRMNS